MNDIQKDLSELKNVSYQLYLNLNVERNSKTLNSQLAPKQQLSLDCKTTWNSMLKMLETIIKLYDVTNEPLDEFGTEHLLTDSFSVETSWSNT